jgi:hypothetical protein
MKSGCRGFRKPGLLSDKHSAGSAVMWVMRLAEMLATGSCTTGSWIGTTVGVEPGDVATAG